MRSLYLPTYSPLVGYILVFIGGSLGAALRHDINRASLALLGANFPAGTLIVNIAGSAILGMLAGWFATRGGDENLRLFLATGVLGGFTTYSAFSLDAVTIWQRGDHVVALANVCASVVASITALSIGLLAARSLA